MGIAKHYETGETLPEDVYKKLLAARTFRAGSLSLRQVCYFLINNFFLNRQHGSGILSCPHSTIFWVKISGMGN